MNITRRNKIHAKIRKTIIGSAVRPRLSVYRSLGNVYAQLIDDSTGKTLAAVSSLKMTGSLQSKAEAVGKEIAAKGAELKVKSVVFDRAGFAYMGAVKTVCETVRQSGITI